MRYHCNLWGHSVTVLPICMMGISDSMEGPLLLPFAIRNVSHPFSPAHVPVVLKANSLPFPDSPTQLWIRSQCDPGLTGYLCLDQEPLMASSSPTYGHAQTKCACSLLLSTAILSDYESNPFSSNRGMARWDSGRVQKVLTNLDGH